MDIRLNGRAISVDTGTTIGDLIRQRGLDPATVVVEHNRAIVASADAEGLVLKESDSLEILRFVGGG
jgi:sulfur carrier protein